jgi:hypothetical protein
MACISTGTADYLFFVLLQETFRENERGGVVTWKQGKGTETEDSQKSNLFPDFGVQGR